MATDFAANAYRISSLNMLTTSPQLAVTEGAACDPPYLYVTPHNSYMIAKIDTRTFKIVDTLDLTLVDPSLTGMLGSFVAGGYLYVLPHLSNTGPLYQDNVVRVDLSNFTPAGCQTLAVLKSGPKLSGSNGLTDGVNGYLNLTVNKMVAVTRFGLGANFNSASVSMVAIPEIAGYPVLLGYLVAVDQTNAYMIATVLTYAGTGNNDRTMDLWLVTVPTANFNAKAAKFQRLTNLNFLGGSMPAIYTAMDDGQNLWTFPMPVLSGPQTGKFLGVMKIPKANPAAVTINQGPTSQAYPSRSSVSGTTFYDGWRYGYVASQTAAQILQLDTQNPGVVNPIDISANSGSYPMYGLGYDGHWGYAVSFNGGAGLCLRFMPTPRRGSSVDQD
ncbi:hypothetical protein OF829_14400 [Sphingomonas sp. LB-2]|uniref:hypothetical protein n=1 Tax=Sphingomonas caeni TaxID=2984949 RepID=UPI0022320E1A|nr:hypothetical protein [Sphingomonas caeni]MCW3848429.1 hypothetical protein [Sphingomonas caeni]